MELEVRHLRALCAIAETGSLHKAARQLGVSQPALTAQVQRIERLLGGLLFHREREGCRPTPLGHLILDRSRSMVEEMRALVTDGRTAAARANTAPLRLGSTASVALPGWLRRLRAHRPAGRIRLQTDVSSNALLRMVAADQLDVAFVHEIEGFPLHLPPGRAGLRLRVLVQREPQFVVLAKDHPAAARPTLHMAELAGEQWMVDPAADGEWDVLRRLFGPPGPDDDVLLGDYHTTGMLVAAGQVITFCQPLSRQQPGVVVRPVHGDPVAARLLLVSRPEREADMGWVFAALAAAYWEAAQRSSVYGEWLANSPLEWAGRASEHRPEPVT
ncbi:LysR family transcriptional regulator [Streptomyces sp. NPDC059009]|uniref:LysR family transcriptional regulator n=1 Tax=Streptomyces sp. NPDC059009 TaxID=3346694 RepID=UPI0036A36437